MLLSRGFCNCSGVSFLSQAPHWLSFSSWRRGNKLDLNLSYMKERERLKCCIATEMLCPVKFFPVLKLQVSEEVPALLLPLCCGNGWPLLPFLASSPDLPLACAFLIYLWLLWWSLCNADPCCDGRCSGNFFLIISTGCCVFSACHTVSSEPACCRSVHKWLSYNHIITLISTVDQSRIVCHLV